MAESNSFKVEELRHQVETKMMKMTDALHVAASRGARSGIEALGAQLEGMPEWDHEIARDVSVIVELHFPRLDSSKKEQGSASTAPQKRKTKT